MQTEPGKQSNQEINDGFIQKISKQIAGHAGRLPTVNEVLERHVEATGGREALLRHKSMTVQGRDEDPGQKADYETVFYTKDGKTLLKVELGGGKEYQTGYDGETAWVLRPDGKVDIAEGDVSKTVARDADMFYEAAALLGDVCRKVGEAVQTWEDKQGPLLAAIGVERGILNVLLFLIVGVAGFSILAIFTMIVAEKTRDIGILKALGASNSGIMSIFVSYGLLLGVIGTIVGTTLGVLLTQYINGVELWLSRITGQEIFDRKIYYFDKIPTDIQLWTVLLIDFGAVFIAVMFFGIRPSAYIVLSSVSALIMPGPSATHL